MDIKLSSIKGVFTHPKTKDLAKGTSTVANGIKNYVPLIKVLSPRAGSLIELATGTVGGTTTLISAITDEEKHPDMSPTERFESVYTLLCHQAYAKALKIVAIKLQLDDIQIPDDDAIKDDNHVLILEETVEFDPSALEPGGAKIKLFDRYSDAITRHPALKNRSDDEKNQFIEDLKQQAALELRGLLCEKGKSPEWVYKFIASAQLRRVIKTQEEHSKAFAELLERIGPGKETIHKEKWDKYRAHLKELPEKEIFGSGENKKYNIKSLFIMPRHNYYRKGYKGSVNPKYSEELHPVDRIDDSDIPASTLSLGQTIATMLKTKQKHNKLVFLFGGPGAGKTSFAKILAAWLADSEYFHPVFVPLINIDPEKNFIDELDSYLKRSILSEAVDSLQDCDGRVFILDAFDELAHSTKNLMSDFFVKIKRAQEDSKYKNSFFLLTGRPTLFDKYDVPIPDGSHVFTLLPFDKTQIGAWSDGWNKFNGFGKEERFDGTRFWIDDEGDEKEIKTEKDDLHDMACQPMLLYLLALLEANGEKITREGMETNASDVYRQIIDWVGDRHEKAHEGDKTALSKTQLRNFLQTVGFYTHAFGTAIIEQDKIEPLLKENKLYKITLGEKTFEPAQGFLLFTFDPKSSHSWEFKHKSFGEFLAAEYIAKELARTTHPDPENADEFSLNESEAYISWSKLFAPSLIIHEVERFLAQMLGNWKPFVTNESNDREKGVEKLMNITGRMFVLFDKEHEFDKSILPVARDYSIQPTKALANLGASILIIGTQCAGQLSEFGEKRRYFEPERLSYGSWFRTYGALDKWFNMNDFAFRFFRGICLDSDNGLDTSDNKATGKTFILMHITKSSYIPYLSIANLSGADLHGANLIMAYMDGAKLIEADLSGAKLFSANLSYADLSYADLSFAKLSVADLSWAKLIRADLKNADLRGATVTPEQVLQTINWREAIFDEDFKEKLLKLAAEKK